MSGHPDSIAVTTAGNDIYTFQTDGTWSAGQKSYKDLEYLVKHERVVKVEGPVFLCDLYVLWDQGRNIPINADNEIEEPWLHFPPGTSREEIWQWFESVHPDFILGKVLSGNRSIVTHIYARNLSDHDIEELRRLVEQAPKKIPYECFWGHKRFLVEELERFLWYYDNRPSLRDQMTCEYIWQN